MISSITTNAYTAFSTITTKIQATSLWSQLPSKSAVATVASNVLFSKYTHAVIGVGIFCALIHHAFSNHIKYINTPDYKEFMKTETYKYLGEPRKDENGNDKEIFIYPEEHTRILNGHVSAVMPPILIATAVLCATLARVILLP